MKNFKILFLLLVTLTVTACGELDSNEVTKNYVEKKFVKQLDSSFGDIEYKLEITSFNKSSNKREATGLVTVKDRFNTICYINGSIEEDTFSASHIGTSYHVYNSCKSTILENAQKILSERYYFEINDTTNFVSLSNNIKSYIKDLQELLIEYKTTMFDYYFSDNYSYAEISIIINGNSKIEKIYIDNYNDLVITDLSAGQFAWRGEIELEEYLELLTNGELQNKIDEIHYNNYGY